MNADQQQVVAEILVQNLQHMNESGTADDVVQALNLINLFLGVDMNVDMDDNMDIDEQKENPEVFPALIDDNAVDDDSDYEDMPALVNDAVEYDSEYDDMPALVDSDNEENYIG